MSLGMDSSECCAVSPRSYLRITGLFFQVWGIQPSDSPQPSALSPLWELPSAKGSCFTKAQHHSDLLLWEHKRTNSHLHPPLCLHWGCSWAPSSHWLSTAWNQRMPIAVVTQSHWRPRSITLPGWWLLFLLRRTWSARQQHSLKFSGTFAMFPKVLPFRSQISKHAEARFVEAWSKNSPRGSWSDGRRGYFYFQPLVYGLMDSLNWRYSTLWLSLT